MGFGPTRKGAGDRRHRVELQTATTTTDALRGRTNTWTTYETYWGAVDVQPFVVSEQGATALYLVTVPYDSRIDTQQRAVVNETLRLKVLLVVNAELRNRDLILHCAQATDEE